MNDHKHCYSCFIPSKCKQQQSCEIIKCVNISCDLKFHKCKLEEHLTEICKYSWINCINVHYGCKMKLLRLNLLKHLENCPANIVECKAFRLRTIVNKDKKYANLKWPDPIQNEKNIVISEAIAGINNDVSSPLANILLDIDTECFKQYASKNKLKFNCFYKYLLIDLNKDDDNFENDKLTLKRFLKMNKISSKIFHDIKIDNCIFFNDEIGCNLCHVRISQLEQERYNKLTANLQFSELLKTVYSYEQFLSEKIYNDKAFLYLYNYFYVTNDQNKDESDDLIINESTLNNELIKSNNDILRTVDLSQAFSLVKVPLDDMKDLNEKYKHLDKYCSFRHRQTVFANTCDNFLKRSQFSSHYNFYHDFLNPMCDEIDKKCPYSSYGCKVFTNKYKFYLNRKCSTVDGKIVNLKDNNCLAVKYYEDKYCKNSSNSDYFEKIPFEVIDYIVDKLDSLSLFNLSMTSKYMRNICMQFIEKRGIVFFKWKKEKFYHADSNETLIYWTYTIHRSFSKHIEPPAHIKACNADKEYMNHIQNCPFKRVMLKTEKFKLYPN
jgi:hypothetical protein